MESLIRIIREEYGVQVVRLLGLEKKEQVPVLDYSPYNRITYPLTGRWIDQQGRAYVYIGPQSIFDIKVIESTSMFPSPGDRVQISQAIVEFGKWVLYGEIHNIYLQTMAARGSWTGLKASIVVARSQLRIRRYYFESHLK